MLNAYWLAPDVTSFEARTVSPRRRLGYKDDTACRALSPRLATVIDVTPVTPLQPPRCDLFCDRGWHPRIIKLLLCTFLHVSSATDSSYLTSRNIPEGIRKSASVPELSQTSSRTSSLFT